MLVPKVSSWMKGMAVAGTLAIGLSSPAVYAAGHGGGNGAGTPAGPDHGASGRGIGVSQQSLATSHDHGAGLTGAPAFAASHASAADSHADAVADDHRVDLASTASSAALGAASTQSAHRRSDDCIHGLYVRAVAHSTASSGEAHGDAVSSAARSTGCSTASAKVTSGSDNAALLAGSTASSALNAASSAAPTQPGRKGDADDRVTSTATTLPTNSVAISSSGSSMLQGNSSQAPTAAAGGVLSALAGLLAGVAALLKHLGL